LARPGPKRPQITVDVGLLDADKDLREKRRQQRIMDALAETNALPEDPDIGHTIFDSRDPLSKIQDGFKRWGSSLADIARIIGGDVGDPKAEAAVREAGGNLGEQIGAFLHNELPTIEPAIKVLETVWDPIPEVTASLAVAKTPPGEVTFGGMFSGMAPPDLVPKISRPAGDAIVAQTRADKQATKFARERARADRTMGAVRSLFTRDEVSPWQAWLTLGELFRERPMAEQLVWSLITSVPLPFTKLPRAVGFAVRRLSALSRAGREAVAVARGGLAVPKTRVATGAKVVEGRFREVGRGYGRGPVGGGAPRPGEPGYKDLQIVTDYAETRLKAIVGEDKLRAQQTAVDTLLTTRGTDEASRRTIAQVELLMATGSRPGHINNLPLEQALAVLERPADDFILPLIKDKEQTQAIRLMPDRRDRTVAALREYMEWAKTQKWFPTDPKASIFRGNITADLKRYTKEIPGLPTQGKEFRRMVAKDLLLAGASETAIMQQLGHNSRGVLRAFYTREVGLGLAESAADSLAKIRDTAPELMDTLSQYAKAARGGKIAKGASKGRGEIVVVRSEVGRIVEMDLKLPQDESKILAELPVENAYQRDIKGLYKRGAELLALKNYQSEVAELSGALTATNKATKLTIKEIEGPVPEAAADSAAVVAADTAMTRELSVHLFKYLQRESGALDISISRFLKAASEDGTLNVSDTERLRQLLRKVDPESSTARELVEAASFAKVGARVQRADRKAIQESQVGQIIADLPLDADDVVRDVAIERWLQEPSIFRRLNATLHRASTPGQVAAAVRRLVGTDKRKGLREALGNDISQERVDQVALGIISSGRGIERFLPKYVPPRDPPQPPVRRPPSVGRTAPLPSQPPKALVDPRLWVGEPIDVMVLRDQVLSNKQLADNFKRLREAAASVVGGRAAVSTLETLLAIGHGGLAPILLPPGRIVAGRNASFRVAEGIGEMVRRGIAEMARTSGVFIESRKLSPEPGLPGMPLWVSGKQTLTMKSRPAVARAEIRAHPDWSPEDIDTYTRSWVLMWELDPNTWDEVYEFASPQARDFYLHTFQLLEGMEDMFGEAAVRYGFKFPPKFLENRVKHYFPQVAVGKAGPLGEGLVRFTSEAAQNQIVAQANLTFTLTRQHQTLSQAMTHSTTYAHPFDSLQSYVTNGHKFVIDQQAVKALKEFAYKPKLVMGRKAGGRALKIILNNKLEGRQILMSDMKLAHNFSKDLLMAVLRDPEAAKESVLATTLVANREAALMNQLAIRELGPEVFKRIILKGEAEGRQVASLSQVKMGGILQPLATVSQFLRFLNTGLDMGMMNIHGLPMLMTKPDKWLKLFADQPRVFLNPRVHGAYVLHPDVFPLIREMQMGGSVLLATGEPTEAAATGGALFGGLRTGFSKIEQGAKKALTTAGMPNSAEELKWMQTFLKRLGVPEVDTNYNPGLVDRFTDVFNVVHDKMMIHYYQAERRPWHTQLERNSLLASINKRTGVFNTDLAGMTPTQKMIESFLLFSSRLQRAVIGLVVDVGRGKLRRDAALKAMGGLGALFGLMYLLSYALGNDDALDFTSPKLGGVQIGKFTIFPWKGPHAAYLRMFTGLAEVLVVANIPEKERSPKQLRLMERQMNWRDNILARVARSKMGPPAQHALTLGLFHRDYLGNILISDEDYGLDTKGFLGYFAESILPFYGDPDNALFFTEGGDAAIAAEFLGGGAFKQSIYDEAGVARDGAVELSTHPDVVQWREKQAENGNPINYYIMPNRYRDLLRTEFPILVAYDEEMRIQGLEHGTAFNRTFDDWLQAVTRFREERNLALQELSELRAHEGPFQFGGKAFRTELDKINAIHRAQIVSLEASEKYKEVYVTLDQGRKFKLRSQQDAGTLEDVALQSWIDLVVEDERLTDEFGNYNYRLREQLEDEWVEHWDKGLRGHYYDYVQDTLKQRRVGGPSVENFELARENLQPYWQLHYSGELEAQGLYEKADGKLSPDAQIVEDWLAEGTTQAKIDFLGGEFTHATAVIKRFQLERERWRYSNQQGDWDLMLWYGDGGTPRHTKNLAFRDKDGWHRPYQELREAWGLR
jgi:hypothetical protein